MACLMISARSFAVIYCPVPGRPLGLMNLVLFSPRAAAFSFMRLTNSFSEPAADSASATAASLADVISAAFRSVSMLMLSPCLSPILVAGEEEAFLLIVATSLKFVLSRTTNAVINLVVLAGISLRSGFFAKRTLPVAASMTTAALDFISSAETVFTSAREQMTRKSKNIKNSLIL